MELSECLTLRGLSFGQRPWGSRSIRQASARETQFASCDRQLDALRLRTTSPEVKRMASIAITEAQGAQIWKD